MNSLDERIINDVMRGSLSAMELIYNKLFGQVYVYAKSYVIDSEQAKEITQDTFLALWEKRESLRLNTNLKALALQIARNKSLNFLKRGQVSRNYDNYLKHREQSINYYALKDKTAELILLQELEQLINNTLEKLPEPYRTVFDMSRLEDLSYAEIAVKLGISVKTVEYRMMHTLQLFRKNLRPYLPFLILFLTKGES